MFETARRLLFIQIRAVISKRPRTKEAISHKLYLRRNLANPLDRFIKYFSQQKKNVYAFYLWIYNFVQRVYATKLIPYKKKKFFSNKIITIRVKYSNRMFAQQIQTLFKSGNLIFSQLLIAFHCALLSRNSTDFYSCTNNIHVAKRTI